jgi:hypothetical protein
MKKPSKSEITKEITKNIGERMVELVAAAASYGAVNHKLYTDARIKTLRIRALKRLTNAAKDYHETLTAAMVLS